MCETASMSAKLGIASFTMLGIALISIILFTGGIISTKSLSTDDERLLMALTVVMPTGIGIILASIGLCCIPSNDEPFFDCCKGKITPLIALILNVIICAWFSLVLSFAG